MLAPLLGGTVFTFGLILAVALTGIGLGSALYAALLSGRRALPLGFALTCAAEAVCIALPYALGDRIAVWTLLLRPIGALGFHGFVFGWTLITACVVLPAALLAGFQFPMLIALLGGGREQVGRDVGAAYGWNTLGAVAGALAGGFGLMRLLGALGCWRLASLLLAVWGALVAVVAIRQKTARMQSGWVFALAALTTVLLLAEGPTAAWRHAPIGAGRVGLDVIDSPNQVQSFLHRQRAHIEWQTDGVESAIALGTHDGVAFIVNGKADGNARTDAPTQVMGALVGAALSPRVRHALVIGLGTGSTAGWLAKVPEVERVDVAEIEPAITRVAERCALVNEDVMENPKVRIQRGDARELLAVSRERYDLIFSEPSNPYRAGVASLYTREFYAAVRERLAPGGLFIQWLQAYDVDSRTTRTIYATLAAQFPHVETWNGLKHDLFLVASAESLVHDAAALRARVATEPFNRALRSVWMTEGLEGFLGHYVANAAFTRTAASGWSELNTDDRSPAEFGFARSLRGEPRDAAESMFQAIRSRGQHRPQLSGEGVDWDKVDYEREAFALVTSSGPVAENLVGGYQTRLQMLMMWAAADQPNALALWNQLGSQAGMLAPIMIERLALSELLAYSNEAQAEAWVTTLTQGMPALSEAMRAVWLSNHGRRAEATDSIERALAAYRSDPWPMPAQMARALQVMQLRVDGDRELAPRWLAALSRPFAVHVNDAARQQARIDLAIALGVSHPACVDVFAEMEPNVVWSGPILDFRLGCYEAHRTPLRARAAQDVLRFRAAGSLPFERLLEQ
jgi:spermidine synthase